MAGEANGKTTNGSGPATNGKAYPIRTTPTTSSSSAPAAPACARPSAGEAGLRTACITKVFPTRSHTVAAQGGIRLARQHGRGRLALAHVRHRQGLRLARRPGRDRIHVPRGARRPSIELEHYGVPFSRTEDGKIYQRAVRRHDHEFRRRAGAAHLRRRRPHRPRDAAHALPAVAAPRRRVLHRVFRARPDHGRRAPAAA
jgi:succinate dehydrogenase/fumarate reductase flavoprotein subunit